MRVQDIMNTRVETVRPEINATEAWERMRARRIHHLLVVKDGDLVGVVSDRDLGGPRGASLHPGRSVGEFMTKDLLTVPPSTTVKKAANLLRGWSVGCLPIVEDGEMFGIVTTSDLLDLIGRGFDRTVQKTKRWTLKHRGPRRRKPASTQSLPR